MRADDLKNALCYYAVENLRLSQEVAALRKILVEQQAAANTKPVKKK